MIVFASHICRHPFCTLQVRRSRNGDKGAHMQGSRNLVVCCDGTWNSSEPESVTNVVKLFNAIEQSDSQLCHYQAGVGTSGGAVSWLAGGASGIGLSRDVLKAYYWLATNYRPGDRIWMFGFSRGAYTVRSL